jgi:hypothetical protein
MAILYVTEYAFSGTIAGHGLPAASAPPITNNNVNIGVGAASSLAFNANTQLVRLHNDSTSPCSILIGLNPTATTSDARMAANQTEYYQVPPGYKVSVIQNP